MSVHWRRRAVALLGLSIAAGLLLSFLLAGGSASHRREPHSPSADVRLGSGLASSAGQPRYADLDAALARGVAAAAALGGDVEAALMLDRWTRPAVETSEPRGAAREMRLWSMSKVPTMIALLRQLGWGAEAGKSTSAELESALEGAIERSENCHQRRVVRELEDVAGGTAAARGAIADVFHRAGATAQVADQVQAPESLCIPYLSTQTEIADPLAPALLLGTSRWRVEDAVRIAHALSTGAFGEALSRRALALMREPQLPSREAPPGELTAPLDWGAGKAFAGLDPAYKAGWGGSLHANFLAGQIAVVSMPDGERLAIAAMFHPDAQPSRDDPGITAAASG